LRLALAQISATDDKDENMRIISRAVRMAAERSADLVALPEYAMFNDFRLGPRYLEEAEDLNGPFCTELRSLARASNATIVVGVLESVPGRERVYNTIVVIDGDGTLIRTYRKMHLYDALGVKESDYLLPGDQDAACEFAVNDVHVGLITCYDIRFPESARALADSAVELAIIPSSWTPGPRKEDHWRVLSRARAIENTFYVASLSQALPISTGNSLLVDPMGVVCGELGPEPGFMVHDIRSDRVANVRKHLPCLVNRRYAVQLKT
jgi:deaminated glutathione amidase